ncbi:hypothetical protein SAY87_032151 [Trapa incisa]|uniref:Uncharacterized protein n=2 Tax=Trapa TaxID=22665 RepID=A0AAN7LVE7_TRANT|nr:hypothetical protein SAY87_032151 [Trapa incisa]KAK4796378.1 hypothetical protein SAY86_028704 [Trapa natans]
MAGLQYYFFPTDFYYPRPPADQSTAGGGNAVAGPNLVRVDPAKSAPHPAGAENDLAKEGHAPTNKGSTSSLGRKWLALSPSAIERERWRAKPVAMKTKKIIVDDH